MNGIDRFRIACGRVVGASARWIMASSRRLRTDRARGQGLVEYALILVLIAVVVIGILSTLGAETSRVFDQVNCTMSGREYHQDSGNGNSNRCR
jgi:pilus assembly protein Flp/PilA